jgi:hypothetical protein
MPDIDLNVLKEKIIRLISNEERVQDFTNDNTAGYYTTNLTPANDVETLPHLMRRLRDRYHTIVFKGVWAPNTNYLINDLVKHPNESSYWLATESFKSGATITIDINSQKLVLYGHSYIPDDTNAQAVWKTANPYAINSVLTLPISYYPGRDCLILWKDNKVLIPFKTNIAADNIYDYRENIVSQDTPSNSVILNIVIPVNSILYALVISSNLARSLEETREFVELTKSEFIALVDSKETELTNFVESKETELTNFVDSKETELTNFVESKKAEVIELKDETEALRDETEALKDETKELKNDTSALKDDTIELKNETKEYREEAWAAVVQVSIEKGDINGRHVFIAEDNIESGEILTLPLYYYPGRNDLVLWYNGAICSPRQPHLTTGEPFQYEEIGEDINEHNNTIRIFFDVTAGDIFDEYVNATGLVRKIDEFEAAIELAEDSATAAAASASNAATSEANAATSEANAEDFKEQAWDIINIAYLTEDEFADLNDSGLYPSLVQRLVSVTDPDGEVRFYGVDDTGEAHYISDVSYDELKTLKTLIDGDNSFSLGNDIGGGYITSETDETKGGIKLNLDKPSLYIESKTGVEPAYKVYFQVQSDGLYISKATTGFAWIKLPEQSDLADLLVESKEYTNTEINDKISGVLKYKGSFIGFYNTTPSEVPNPATNDIALNSNGSEKATYNGTSWVITIITHSIFDLWANLTDSHGYYWFNSEWNLLDFNVDMSVKEDIVNKITTLATVTNDASDTKYPSEKAVVSALATKENSSNKVIAIRAASSATDFAYPSEKAVRTLVDLVNGEIPDISNLQTKLDGTSGQVVTYTATAGTLTGTTLNKSSVGLGNVDNTADADKPVSTAQATAIDAKEDSANKVTTIRALASATDIAFPSEKAVRTLVDNIEIPDISGKEDASNKITSIRASDSATDTAYPSEKAVRSLVDSVAGDIPDISNLQTKLSGTSGQVVTYTATAGTLTGTALNKSVVGLGNVDNTSDVDKPVSTAQATAIADKENLSNKVTTIRIAASATDTAYPSEKAVRSLVDTVTGNIDIPDISNLQTKLSGTSGQVVTYTETAGTLSGTALNKSAVGLGNVDNTSDADKPVSTAQATAIWLKQDKLSGTSGQVVTYTATAGTLTGTTLNKSSVGLANVDNTADVDKPVSTPQGTAIDAKEDSANKVITVRASATATDIAYPSEKAVRSLVDSIEIPDVSNFQTKLSGTSGQAVVYTSTVGTLSGAAIPTAGTTATTQAIGDTSAAGSATTWSKSDHKHGLPAFGTTATSLTSGGTGSVGTAATLSRSDHTHTLPTIPDISGKQDKVPAGTAGVVLTQSGTAGTFSTKATDTTPTASSTNLVTSGGVKTALDLKANLASPTFTGTPAAPTATAGTNTTQLATTAFVTAANNLKANLASPTFTGTPAGPTAAAGTNTTQLATTAFVTAAVSTSDFLIDRIHWEPSVSEDPIKTLIPTGYSYAQIIYIGTDGSATTLTLSKTYSTGSVVLSTTKTSISGFSGIGVTFTPAITGGTQADFEIKYTKS